MRKKAAGSKKPICTRKIGRSRCNNVSGDNKFQYCENHYKQFTDLVSNQTDKRKKTTPPDELRCCVSNRVWRCKNYRMMKVGTTVPTSKYCEHHDKDDEQCCCVDSCKNFRMNADEDDDGSVPNTKFCHQHYFDYLERRQNLKNQSENVYKDFTDLDRTRKKKKKKRIRYGKDLRPRKNVTEDSSGSGTQQSSTASDTSDDTSIETTEPSNRSKRRKNDRSADETGIQPEATNDTCESDKLIEGGSIDIGMRKKKVKRTDGNEQVESLTTTREPVVELESLEHYKSKCFELSAELEEKKLECTQLQDATEYWRKMFSDLESRVLRMEDANSTMRCVDSRITKLESLLLSMNNRILTIEKSVESRISNMESQNRRIENENLTIAASVESRISKLQETLVLKSGNETSVRRCSLLHNSEIKESRAQGVQDDVPQNDEKRRSKPNAETCSGGRKDLNVYDIGVNKQNESESQLPKYSVRNISSGRHLSSAGRNVKEERPYPHGSTLRRDHINMNVKACAESRTSNLESPLPRSSKQSSLSRCVKLQDSVKIKSEPWDLPKEVAQIGENKRDQNYRSKPNAESGSGRRKDSNVCDLITGKKNLNVSDVGVTEHHDSAMNISSGSLHLSSGVANVEERKDGMEARPSQHGPLSHDHLGMSRKDFVNLVSDDDSESEDSDSSTDSGGYNGDLMKMLAMKIMNQNKDKEIKWKFEADMLSSFEEDPVLCMKAVCALYRQQISGAGTSAKGMFQDLDLLRVTTLANFLMDEDCQGDIKKSVRDLEIFNSEAVEDCKRLATRYSKQLFSIYQNGTDPFFLASTSAKS